MAVARRRVNMGLLGTIVFTACGSHSVDEPVGRLQAGVTTASTLAGYVHSIDRSRFRIGQGTTLEVNAPTLRRWRGSLGTFAVDPTNGWSMGDLNADAPRGPYILDDTAQGTHVKAYFVAAGLPIDQVAWVGATYNVEGGGAVSDPASGIAHLESINSILRRSINGIKIIESVAWAKMTTAGDVDAEYVFWPPIDMSVVNAATAFAATIGDAAAHTAFISRLPGVVQRDDGVVIHHTSPVVHAAATAYVAYDVVLGTTPTTERHFDVTGLEFRLPQEMTKSSGMTKRN